MTDNTRALMEQLGQAPVVLKKEVNGFILNRLQYAFYITPSMTIYYKKG